MEKPKLVTATPLGRTRRESPRIIEADPEYDAAAGMPGNHPAPSGQPPQVRAVPPSPAEKKPFDVK